MRSKLFFLLLIVMSLISINNVNAASNPYHQKERVPNNATDTMTNCTWYAWQQAYDKTGVDLPNLGNAKNWYNKAKALGYHVGTEAKVNSIAVWDNSGYGHVGFVVAVDGTRMTINEGGVYEVKRELDEAGNIISTKYVAYNGTGIYNGNWASTKIGESRYEDGDTNASKLIGFIYLDYVPPTTTIKKKTTTKETITSTTTLTSTTKRTTTKTDIEEIKNTETETSSDLSHEDTNNIKGILPYLILVSMLMFIFLLVLANVTKNTK